MTFFCLSFLGTGQERKERGSTLRNYYYYFWYHHFTTWIPNACYQLADLLYSALLPFKEISVCQYSRGRCWIRALLLIPALEDYKSFSSVMPLNICLTLLRRAICLQCWLHLSFMVLCLDPAGAFCFEQKFLLHRKSISSLPTFMRDLELLPYRFARSSVLVWQKGQKKVTNTEYGR